MDWWCVSVAIQPSIGKDVVAGLQGLAQVVLYPLHQLFELPVTEHLQVLGFCCCG
jgi:hypothetical protein